MSIGSAIIPLFSGGGVLIAAALGRAAWKLGWRILDAVHRIEAQTKNNGGSSLRDAVDRIEERQHLVIKRQKKLSRQMHQKVGKVEVEAIVVAKLKEPRPDA